jgi:Raf kinase inhibitor-like YbhB/YbcL family protein
VPGTLGKNSYGKTGYSGPCPLNGVHRYFFKIYALDTKLDLGEGAEVGQLEAAMKGHILSSGELIGLYRKAE